MHACVCMCVCVSRGCEPGTESRLIHPDVKRTTLISGDHQSGHFHRYLIPLRAKQIF